MPIHIPQTPLAQHLAQAAALQAEMTKLLRQLEEQEAGHPIAKPGAWRHRPQTNIEMPDTQNPHHPHFHEGAPT